MKNEQLSIKHAKLLLFFHVHKQTPFFLPIRCSLPMWILPYTHHARALSNDDRL